MQENIVKDSIRANEITERTNRKIGFFFKNCKGPAGNEWRLVNWNWKDDEEEEEDSED